MDYSNLFMGLYSSCFFRYHLKAWLFAFPLILHLSWLLCRKVHGAIKLGSMSKNKCCKIGPHEIVFIMLGIIWKPILFFCQLVHYLFWLHGRNVRKVIILDAMSKIKCSKMFQNCTTFLKFSMMFCFGGFRYNEWAVGTRVYAHKRRVQNMTYM